MSNASQPRTSGVGLSRSARLSGVALSRGARPSGASVLLVIALALAGRLAYLGCVGPLREIDTGTYLELGHSIAMGQGFGTVDRATGAFAPYTLRVPLFSGLVAAIERTCGAPVDRPLAAVNVVFAVLIALITLELGFCALGPPAGVLAAAIVALSPAGIHNTAGLLTDVPFGLLTALALRSGLGALSRPRAASHAQWGLWIGLSALVRPLTKFYPFLMPILAVAAEMIRREPETPPEPKGAPGSVPALTGEDGRAGTRTGTLAGTRTGTPTLTGPMAGTGTKAGRDTHDGTVEDPDRAPGSSPVEAAIALERVPSPAAPAPTSPAPSSPAWRDASLTSRRARARRALTVSLTGVTVAFLIMGVWVARNLVVAGFPGLESNTGLNTLWSTVTLVEPATDAERRADPLGAQVRDALAQSDNPLTAYAVAQQRTGATDAQMDRWMLHIGMSVVRRHPIAWALVVAKNALNCFTSPAAVQEIARHTGLLSPRVDRPLAVLWRGGELGLASVNILTRLASLVVFLILPLAGAWCLWRSVPGEEAGGWRLETGDGRLEEDGARLETGGRGLGAEHGAGSLDVQRRRCDARTLGLLLTVTMAYHIGLTSAVAGSDRYRMPVEPALALLAAAAVCRWGRLERGAGRRETGGRGLEAGGLRPQTGPAGRPAEPPASLSP